MSLPKLRLYNTLTRSKEDFVPIDEKNVRMYVCGPTVYDYAHIGNARPVIVFDVLYRLLRHLAKQGAWDGGKGETKVTYVRNITDVDDKINARAAQDFPGLPLNDAIRAVTEKTANQFMADTKALGCLEPDVQPRATDNIREMIAIIQTLIANGHAYVADGEVLFSVTSMRDYGRLSNRTLDEQQAGARVAVEAHKRNPGDFVLWKLSNAEEPGWDSPWGRGRPGWHIECSAMSHRYLGETFDIHGGGLDLIFPHHENEIAQSRCAFGHDVMANVWMHNGFLQVEGEKMSKSLGNFVTINELLNTQKFGGRKWPGEVLRLAMLRTHYRQPIDWTVKALEEAERTIWEWRRLLHGASRSNAKPSENFIAALSDDLNTHAAMTEIHKLAAASKSPSGEPYTRQIEMVGCLEIMGFDELLKELPDTDDVTSDIRKSISEVEAQKAGIDLKKAGQLITARLEARKAKNFAESDRIRDELLAMGIQLKDAKDPATGEMVTTWEVKR